jgi:hypothetical protein
MKSQSVELLMIERAVLESLSRKPQNLGELHDDTSLDYGLLNCLLGMLMQKNLIVYKQGKYELGEKARSGVLNTPETIKGEIKELMASLLDNYLQKKAESSLKIRKVWMTQKEETIFNAQLKSLEMFLQGLGREKSKKTRQQKCILWAYSDYESLLQENLRQAS